MTSFKSLGLDQRLLQAFNQLEYHELTPVQSKAIPIALHEQKDILAKARTGSGKTAAYLIPIIQSILVDKASSDEPRTQGLILVPTRELAEQVTKLIGQLTIYCSDIIQCVNIAQEDSSSAVQNSLLAQRPTIVVATPAGAASHAKDKTLETSNLKYLVLDEVDLVVSFGYDDDLEYLAEALPVNNMQSWLMSATMSSEVDRVKRMFCRNLAVIKLEDSEDSNANLSQFYVKCSEKDKFLLAYVIFKLKLIKGKTLIFINSTDRCYQLKLFLEQFGVGSCVLNGELPLASRLHVVEQFNKGVFDLLLATDVTYYRDEDTKTDKQDKEDRKTASSKSETDREFGVSRGIDFHNVACVLNFDLPTSSRAYTHRVGRTARAGKAGMALSFVIPKEKWGKDKGATLATAEKDEKILARIIKSQEKIGSSVKPYAFDMSQLDPFRYRMNDVFASISKMVIREARVKEIKKELLSSDKLKRHFEENPGDLVALRHDQDLHPNRIKAELKHIPDYLLPADARGKADRVLMPAGQKIAKKKYNNKFKKNPLKTFRR